MTRLPLLLLLLACLSYSPLCAALRLAMTSGSPSSIQTKQAKSIRRVAWTAGFLGLGALTVPFRAKAADRYVFSISLTHSLPHWTTHTSIFPQRFHLCYWSEWKDRDKNCASRVGSKYESVRYHQIRSVRRTGKFKIHYRHRFWCNESL